MRSRRLLLGAAVGLVALAVYLDALRGDFVYDDHALVRFDPAVRDASAVGSFFAGDLWGRGGHGETNYYRPLPRLIFAAVHRVAGETPWAFRLVNLLLHALASALVFRLLVDLLRGRPPDETPHATVAAFAGALLFAVHPAHVEAVAWISGIMDVACTAFALLAFDLYRRADATPRGRVRSAFGLVAFLLAMLAKEPAVVLPAVFVLYDLLRPESAPAGWRARAARWLPWFAVLALYLALRATALGGLAPRARPDLPGLGDSLLLTADLFARYLRTIFLPVDLSLGAFAPPPAGWGTARGAVALAVVLATATLAGLAWRRHRVALFGLALFALPLAPALYLPALVPQLAKLFSERFLYFPSAGWSVAVGSLLCLAAARAGRGARFVWLAVALIAATWTVATVRQIRVWRSEVALWQDAVAKYPGHGANHLDLGNALLAAGEPVAARRAFARAAVVDPGLVGGLLRQGAARLRGGQPAAALLKYEQALALAPDSFEALLGAADAGNAAGWSERAAVRYRAALALRPQSAAAHNGYGFLLARQGELEAAIEQFEAAVAAAPDDPVPLRNLATALERHGEVERAQQLRARAAALTTP